ncbi:MAG: NAD(P)/FAD-dependent oxidoreductase [Actinomycetota bacterium]
MAEPVRADVVVMGAGVAGVAAARALAQGGLKVVVVEAGDRVGGRVHTVRDLTGYPVEAGAEFIHGNRAATWQDVRAAGLVTEPAPYVWSWFNLAGTTRWLPFHLAHPGVWRSFDILWSLHRIGDRDESAAQFIARKGYRGRARELAQLTLTAHLPGSVDEVGVAGLGADGILHLEGGVNHRVTSGYDLLPAHIGTGLDIRFGFRARRIAWAPDGVEITAADGAKVTARAAVSTLPHGVLTRGDIEFEPGLPAAKSDALNRLATGPVAKVLLSFEDPFWPTRASQVVCGSGPVTLYWPTSFRTDGPPTLSAYATGPRAQALSDAGAEKALDIVLDDLVRVFPGSRPRSSLRGWRFVDWMTDPNALGGYTFLPPRAIGARQDLAAPTTGALFWAGSATESRPVADTVEAAYLSGLRAARQVSSLLR